MPKPLLVVVGGLVAIVVVTTALFLTDHPSGAAFVSSLTLPWMVAALLYVALIHSRGRWPGLPWWERFMRVITFTR